jgi:hypothetical protein
LKVKVKKKEIKSYPTVVQLAIWNIMNCSEELLGARVLVDALEAYIVETI